MATVELHQEQPDHTSSALSTFLGAIADDNGNKWSLKMYVESKPIRFRADTGADLSVIPYGLYELFSQKARKAPKFKL